MSINRVPVIYFTHSEKIERYSEIWKGNYIIK
jgi:hypothetical protein